MNALEVRHASQVLPGVVAGDPVPSQRHGEQLVDEHRPAAVVEFDRLDPASLGQLDQGDGLQHSLGCLAEERGVRRLPRSPPRSPHALQERARGLWRLRLQDPIEVAHPVEMIRGAIRPPAFLLDNERVITRHARALALELCGENLPSWMGELVSDNPEGDLTGIAPVRSALAADAPWIAGRIHDAFRAGLDDAQLPWLTTAWCQALVDNWVADLDTAVEPFRLRQKALLEEWEQAVATRTRESARAIVSIQAGLDAMRHADRIRAYVLSYLNSVGFLPSYAFPTDTTSLFLESETTELSQNAVQALKDYAPGQLVYARGTKWLVNEVDLRRANLVNADGAGAIPTVNICLRCDTVNDKTAASCLSCDSSELQAQVAVPMRAMRAERRQRISSDEEHRARRPFDVTHHLGAPQTAETWLFEHPGLVMQWERGSHLTVLNRGRLSNVPGDPAEQFLVCTSCGMTFEPPGPTGPTQAQRKHDEWHDRRCTTHDQQFAVLMTQRRVDCLQLLPDMEAFDIRPANLQEYLASIRAALDLGSRIVLQSGDGEVDGFDWPRPDPDSADAMLRLAVLYEEVPAAPATSASSPSGSAKSPTPSSPSSTAAPARSPATPACAPTATSRNPTSSTGTSPPTSCAASPEPRPCRAPASPPSPTGSPACPGPRSSGASPSPSSTQEPPAASPSTPGATAAPPTAAPAPSPSSTSPGPTGKSPSSATAGKPPHPRAAGSRQGKARRPPRRRIERPDLLGRPDRPRRRRLRTPDHRRPEST